MNPELALYIFGITSCIAVLWELSKHYAELDHVDMKLHPLTCMECGNAIGYSHEPTDCKVLCNDCSIAFVRIAELIDLKTITPNDIINAKYSNIEATHWEFHVRAYCNKHK